MQRGLGLALLGDAVGVAVFGFEEALLHHVGEEGAGADVAALQGADGFRGGGVAVHCVASQVICWETGLKHYFMNVKRCFRHN